ncbi:MAG: GHKL domain-containing protein, partial [Saprospirales bacterium]
HSSGYKKYLGLTYRYIGRVFEAEGNYSEAEKYYDLSVAFDIEENNPDFLGEGYLALARLNKTTGFFDSSYELAHKALSKFRGTSDTTGLIRAHETLASVFDARAQIDSAYYYLKEGIALRSAFNDEERVKEFQVLGLNEQLRLKELETEKVLLQSRIRTYGLAAGIGVLLLISMITYRSNLRQKRDKAIIEESYTNLKAAQDQLVQQEKLASLGQLTAGIAHEIKNPLNFVNNFSDLSVELIDEALEVVQTRHAVSQKDEGLDDIKDLLNTVKSNLEKVHQHGNRADSIVKSMLMHSRGGNGKIEPTDLNALIKEYVNLAFHGMRAGKGAINVKIDLELQETIKEVTLNTEDFSRVILNLCKNAFDAMRTKGLMPENKNYQPVLTVRTYKDNKNIVHLEIEDNGPGVPKTIREKLFQPFFTTKKGTEGTGLGLSITHDIITRHRGTIKVISKENAFTRFHILLPQNHE